MEAAWIGIFFGFIAMGATLARYAKPGLEWVAFLSMPGMFIFLTGLYLLIERSKK